MNEKERGEEKEEEIRKIKGGKRTKKGGEKNKCKSRGKGREEKKE